MKCCYYGPWCLAVGGLKPLISGFVAEHSTTVLMLRAGLAQKL
jgi:hypothetical protein